jgi:hypothetical protein
MPTLASLALLLLAGAEPSCSSVAQCNRLGSEELRAGRHDAALRLFEIQIDLAETALKAVSADADAGQLAHAREIAINNAGLAQLRAGDCLRARAWLEAADADHSATQANRRQLEKRCAGQLTGSEHTGQFWQYAGHGAWNSLSIRPTGDETLRLDASWLRVGRGPLAEWGAAAIGELDQVYLHVEGREARGVFAGNDPDSECQLHVRYVTGGIELEHTAKAECSVGGAGATLGGRYWRVGEEAPLAEE